MRWFIALVLVGCGGRDPTPAPDAPPTDDPFVERSGTRLQRRGYDVGGARLLHQIYDVVRGQPCAPQRWVDGQSYCTPYENIGYARYADAACTQPVGVVELAALPDHVVRLVGTDCDYSTIRDLYPLGARLPQTVYYEAIGDECRSYAVGDGAAVFALGPPVPPSELVAVTTSEPAGTHRLRRRFHESADGLRFAVADLHDSELATACYVADRADEERWTCLPLGLGGTTFSDATCTTPAVAGGTCGAPAFASENLEAGCPYPELALYGVGPEIGTMAYGDQGGVCILQVETRVFARGAPVTAATGTRATGGDGRIQRIVARGEDDFATIQLYDSVLQTRCGITEMADGSLRCMPFGMPIVTLYRDAACTQPVEVTRRYHGAAHCAERPPVRYGYKIVEVDPRTFTTDTFRVTGPEAGPLFEGGPGSCMPARSGYRYFAIGARVPPSEMALALPAIDG